MNIFTLYIRNEKKIESFYNDFDGDRCYTIFLIYNYIYNIQLII